MSLGNVAEDYFSKLNSIAGRMYADMKETKMAYEELWDTISEKEQQQILSESIITPEVSVKYQQSAGDNAIKEYAVKIVIDDNCSYRDEHSAPFSFKTRSQRDLTLFEKEKENDQRKIAQTQTKVLKPKPNVQKIVDVFMDKEMEFDHGDDPRNNLPKTGLDFLDNW